MTPSEIITTLLVGIGGGSAIIAALSTWLGKVWADRIERMEKARTERDERMEKARAAREIEILKSSLAVQAGRFTLLHSKRAEVLSELYQHLATAYVHTSAMAGKAPQNLDVAKKSAEAALDSIRSALNLISTRKIWLSKALAEKAGNLIGNLQTPVLVYHYYTKERYSDQDVLAAVAEWNTHNGEVKLLLTELEDEFRSILEVADKP